LNADENLMNIKYDWLDKSTWAQGNFYSTVQISGYVGCSDF